MQASFRTTLAAMLIACAAPALAQDAPASSAAPAMNGLHPDQHGPSTADTPEPAARAAPPPVIVTARRPRHRRWKATAGRIRRCERRFRSYNPRTNTYVAHPGVRRRCVL